MAVKAIEVSAPLSAWIERSLAALSAESIAVTHEVAAEAYALPGRFHKDPVDRILVAAARRNHMSLLTADERILRYAEVRSLDARR